MEWQNVTVDELVSALKEVDWRQPPRPLLEFCSKFTTPKNQAKWLARVKCNVYYYRTNYFIILILFYLAAFYANLGALLALLVCFLAFMTMNDTFANMLNDKGLRVIKKLHPQTAAKIRLKSGGSGLGAPGRSARGGDLFIVGIKRKAVVGLLAVVGLVLLYRTNALLTVALAYVVGSAIILLHASMRVQNLKARLASAREEFKSVWRGYQYHDYTL